MKFGKNGNGIWAKMLHKDTVNYYHSTKIMSASDGKNLLFAYNNDNELDVALVDTSGLFITNTTRYTFPDYTFFNFDMAEPKKNNSLVIAHSPFIANRRTIVVSKTDATGNIQWTKRLGGNMGDMVTGIIVQKDKSIALLGITYSYGVKNGDVYLLKSDSSGSFNCNEKIYAAPTITHVKDSSEKYACSFGFAKITPMNVNFFTSTTVKDTIQDACGCEPPKAIFKKGTGNTIINNSVWASNFVWDFGNGMYDSAITPTLPFSISGTYNVCLTVINACGKDSVCHPVKYTATSISPIDKREKITLYPNPFHSETVIELDEEQKNIQVKIIDLLGREMRMIFFSGKKFILEKGDLKGGIYFIQLQDQAGNMISKKIVVE